jgi:hypothetical protein
MIPIQAKRKAWDAMWYSADKPTSSVATPVVQTPTHDSEWSGDEPRDAIRHENGEQAPSALVRGEPMLKKLTQINLNKAELIRSNLTWPHLTKIILTQSNLTQPNPF